MLYLTHLQEQPIECESTLERDFVLVAALFPGTHLIQHQPFRLELANERHYTPDFLVHFKDGSRAVVEVKPKVHIRKHAARLLDADERMRQSDNLLFFVIDESQITAERKHEHSRLIRRYGKSQCSQESCARVLSAMAPGHSRSLAQLVAECQVDASVVLHLMALRRITFVGDISSDESAQLTLSVHTQQEIPYAVQFGAWFDVAPWATRYSDEPRDFGGGGSV
jgi:hypothetical protein